MKVLYSFVIALCFLPRALPQQTGASDNADTRAFTKDLQTYANLFKLPGLSVAVVRNGKIIYRLNEGYSDVEHKTPMGDDAVFSIASVTKTFTGVMMMQLEQEGKISLDDYLLKYPLDTKLYSPRIIDANVRLKHVLSMTSDGVPGATFSYNGGRFNFLSGIFDQMSQQILPDSYSSQVNKRILDPLHMISTFDGYPSQPNGLTPRVVNRYRLEPAKDGVVYTNVPYDSNAAYPAPAAGLFSTIDDLAAYATALDNNTLISHDKYVEMTSPFVTGAGRRIPYGYGWLTQQYLGVTLHWAYGEGDLDSALLLRVPARGLTFIFLTNSGFPSHASRPNSGNVLRSPFAIAFLKHFVFQDKVTGSSINYDDDIDVIRKDFLTPSKPLDPICYEELYTQALVRNYIRTTLHETTTKPEQLTRLLFEVHPQSFDSADIPLIVLLSRIDTRELHPAAGRLIRSFDVASERRPEALYFIGKYYEAIGDRVNAMKYFQLLADQPGFIDEGAKIDACLILGRYYLKQGEVEKGRDYVWKSALYARDAGYSGSYMTDIIGELDKK